MDTVCDQQQLSVVFCTHLSGFMRIEPLTDPGHRQCASRVSGSVESRSSVYPPPEYSKLCILAAFFECHSHLCNFGHIKVAAHVFQWKPFKYMQIKVAVTLGSCTTLM